MDKYIVMVAVFGYFLGACVGALLCWSLFREKKKDKKAAYDIVYPQIPQIASRSLNIQELKAKMIVPLGYGFRRVDDEEKLKDLIEDELSHKLAEQLKPLIGVYRVSNPETEIRQEWVFCASIKVIDERGKDD